MNSISTNAFEIYMFPFTGIVVHLQKNLINFLEIFKLGGNILRISGWKHGFRKSLYLITLSCIGFIIQIVD